MAGLLLCDVSKGGKRLISIDGAISKRKDVLMWLQEGFLLSLVARLEHSKIAVNQDPVVPKLEVLRVVA